LVKHAPLAARALPALTVDPIGAIALSSPSPLDRSALSLLTPSTWKASRGPNRCSPALYMEGKPAPKSLLVDGICLLSPRQRRSIRSTLHLLPPSTWKASRRSNRCSQTGITARRQDCGLDPRSPLLLRCTWKHEANGEGRGSNRCSQTGHSVHLNHLSWHFHDPGGNCQKSR
jgi:ribosomal protein S14